MKISPAIPDRSTEELLEIIEAPDEWQQAVIPLAQKELQRRGVSDNTQNLRKKINRF